MKRITFASLLAIALAALAPALRPIVFTSTQSATAVAAKDLKISWQIVSLQYREDYYRPLPYWIDFPDPVDGRTTQHRIYTLYRAPVDSMAVPWAKALELPSGMMSTLTGSSTEESAVHLIADGIFYSRWTEYDTRFFEPARGYLYNPSGTCSCSIGGLFDTQQYLNLQYVLDELGSTDSAHVELQCNDTSNFHAILAASQGITALPTFIHDTRSASPGPWVLLQPTALHRRAGEIPEADPPCRVNEFLFHQVASLANLYDTSVRSATGTIHSCMPGANLFGGSQAAYLSAAFPTQLQAFTSFTRPTVGINACNVQ